MCLFRVLRPLSLLLVSGIAHLFLSTVVVGCSVFCYSDCVFYHVTGAAGLKVECSQKCRRRRRRNGEGRIGLLCLSWPCACGSPRFVFCLGFFTHAPLSAALFQHFFTRRFEQGRGNMSEIDSWKKLGTH
jgi:hypothetical protein